MLESQSSYQLDEYGMLEPVADGVRVIEDGEVSYHWMVFDREHVERYLERPVEQQPDLGIALVGSTRSYGGPGRSFRDDPCARVSRHRVLVTVRCGLDI